MKTGNTETMRSRVQALTADLERQVQELFDSDRYREFLDAMAKFHHYSLNNSLLILMQRPDAEQVASFATWRKLGRQVKTGAKGYFSPAGKEIVIRQDLSERHSFHTALHELTHALLHSRSIDRKIDRETNEVIAESVSYVVCRALQIDTKDYSCGYICGWSRGREIAELKASLATIRDLSAELIPEFETKKYS